MVGQTKSQHSQMLPTNSGITISWYGRFVKLIKKKVSTHPNTANQFSLRVLGTYKVKENIENEKKQISKRGKEIICSTGKLISDQFVIRKP